MTVYLIKLANGFCVLSDAHLMSGKGFYNQISAPMFVLVYGFSKMDPLQRPKAGKCDVRVSIA